LFLSLILLLGTHFKIPQYYTDYELAQQIAAPLASNEVKEAVKHLLNPKYNFFNIIFNVWGYCVAIFIFSLIFKIKNFNRFKELKLFNKKLFIYPWINLSCIIWVILYVWGYMEDIYKYVYSSSSDSFGIPLFFSVTYISFIVLIFCIIVNFLSFITYNTKVKRKLYSFVWCLVILFWLLFIVDSFRWRFCYINIISDFIYFVWIVFAIYSTDFIRSK